MGAETTELVFVGEQGTHTGSKYSSRLFINYEGEMVPLKWRVLADIPQPNGHS